MMDVNTTSFKQQVVPGKKMFEVCTVKFGFWIYDLLDQVYTLEADTEILTP